MAFIRGTRQWLVFIAGLVAGLVLGSIVGCVPRDAHAGTVRAPRTTLTLVSDTTLRGEITWTLVEGVVPPIEAVEVRFGLDNGAVVVDTVPVSQTSDTLTLTVSAYGTITGYGCVASLRQGQASEPACTPWQYVRMAPAPPAPTGVTVDLVDGGTAPAPEVAAIIVRPVGVQVDPDIDGRCARYQREHPDAPVWPVRTRINVEAIAECTGPNGRPVVAQFCGLYERADGATGLTVQSAAVPYCHDVYQRWLAERPA